MKRFKCSVCPYKTNRSHDLDRHKKSKHESEAVVLALLENLISNLSTSEDMPLSEVTISLLEDDGCDDDVDEEEKDKVANDKIYPYEMMRNERVALLQREFEKECPDFEKEMRDMKDKMAVRTGLPRKKKESDPTPSRKSSRIKDKVEQTSDFVDELGGGMELEPGVHVGEPVVEDNGDVEVELESALVIMRGNGDVEPGPVDLTDESGSHLDVLVDLSEDAGDNHEHPGRFACLPCEMGFR